MQFDSWVLKIPEGNKIALVHIAQKAAGAHNIWEESRMENMIYRVFEIKEGRNWRETYRTEDMAMVYEDLAHELLNLKVFKMSCYKRMTHYNNYDGTRTIIIYQDTGRSVYRIKA